MEPSMQSPSGARTFLTSGRAYDSFMGRYSAPLAAAFADSAGVAPGMVALDVGCGPGSLTEVLAQRLGPAAVTAVDPSPPFVAECGARFPGVEVTSSSAEALPFPDGSFDVVLAQLVLHFVADPAAAGREFRRVVRDGGTAAACVWDFASEMEMLRHFWDAALTVDPDAPDEARVLRFGRPGEIAEWLVEAGFVEIEESTMKVSTTYADFDEMWGGFMHGIGPAGSFCLSLSEQDRVALRTELYSRVGSPTGPFTLSAVARSAAGRAPG